MGVEVDTSLAAARVEVDTSLAAAWVQVDESLAAAAALRKRAEGGVQTYGAWLRSAVPFSKYSGFFLTRVTH